MGVLCFGYAGASRSKSKKGSKSGDKKKEYLERKELENEQLELMGTPELRGKNKKKAKKPKQAIEAIPSFSVGPVTFGNPLLARRTS